ncbi:MAG: HAD family phosphatase [Treponema sp.]|jgi:putative hydrolase of the HAD superfamily|nr:HAD family phosphatase [Treponema sp.]
MAGKAVVFDFGKVISFPPEDSVMEELAAIAGLEVNTMDGLVWKYRGEYDRGTVSAQEYYRTMLGSVGIFPDDAALERMIRIDLQSWTRINPETVALMEKVKRSGYILGILSNMPHDFLALARSSFPVFSLPQVSVFSCETGSIKPEKAIYRTLLDRVSCKAEEVVFFDDIQINIDAAKEAGIRAFLWKDPKTAWNVLQQAGIPL